MLIELYPAINSPLNTENGFDGDFPGMYHHFACGFSFADGHSEIKKWKDGRTLGIRTTYTTTFPFGLFQRANLDILWVQERTSTRVK